MNIILFFFAFYFVTSKDYYINEMRNYTSQISSSVYSTLLFPKSVTTSRGNVVDFAFGTSLGYLYLGSLLDYDLKQYRLVSELSLNRLQWINGFIHIVSGDGIIRVVDISRNSSDWIKFQSKKNGYIYAFGFSQSRKSYLAAYGSNQINRNGNLIVEQNSTVIYRQQNISIGAASFNISGDYFYFYCSPKYDNPSQRNISLSILSISSRTVTKFGSNLTQFPYPFVFVPTPGYQHLFFSGYGGERNFSLYKSQSPSKINSIFFYKNIIFTGDGSNLVGIVDYKSSGLNIVEIDTKSANLVKPQSYQTLLFNRTIYNFYTNNDYILVQMGDEYTFPSSPVIYICSTRKSLKEIGNYYVGGYKADNDGEVLNDDKNEEFEMRKQIRDE